jgi:ribosomal protein S18 acetylase RimI-like enzyme
MQVRQATIADAENIARIHVATWQAAYRGLMPDAVLDNLRVEKRASFWQTHLSSQPLQTFVAEFNGSIIGFCDLVPSRDKDSNPKTVAEIVAIYIHPNHWRHGAGRALCHRALEMARREHFTAVTLWSLGSNIAARKFYEAMGFRLDGATKFETIGNHELHQVRFRISL